MVIAVILKIVQYFSKLYQSEICILSGYRTHDKCKNVSLCLNYYASSFTSVFGKSVWSLSQINYFFLKEKFLSVKMYQRSLKMKVIWMVNSGNIFKLCLWEKNFKQLLLYSVIYID